MLRSKRSFRATIRFNPTSAASELRDSSACGSVVGRWQSTNRPLASDTDFLSIALSPFALSGGKAWITSSPKSLTRSIGQDEPSSGCQSPDRCLSGHRKAAGASAAWLLAVVTEQGGSLVLFAGPKADDKVGISNFSTNKADRCCRCRGARYRRRQRTNRG